MTAEIAILNRTAVALAADSVVTLNNNLSRKTYDSAEKIFQLSRYQPIACMIYNNAQYMNAPLEVIIRNYRSTLTTGQFSKLIQVWPAFEKYLLDFSRDSDEYDHLKNIALNELRQIRHQLFNRVFESIGAKRTKKKETDEQFALRIIQARRDAALNSPLEGYINDKTLEDFTAKYSESVAEIIARTVPFTVAKEIEDAIHEMLFAIVKSNGKTNSFTGFVFAGFGEKDLFPTLDYLELDGLYFGQFRILVHNTVDIDRQGDTSAIVPFAQQDMPQRFMYGIDSELEDNVQGLVDSLVGQIVDQNKRAFKNGMADLVKQKASEHFKDGLERLKQRSLNSLKGIVNHLSKKELGEFAYSLVELTSRKRRYSSDLETVGGPIDVAILTRNEGFIWVRRKHYFDATLNPQYSQYTQR